MLAVTLFGRVALGRPWRIEAIREGERRAWDVAGWRESRLAMDELRRSALGTGEPRMSRGRVVAPRQARAAVYPGASSSQAKPSVPR